MNSNILFTGGSGLLATNWANNLKKKYNIFLGLHKKIIKINNITSIPINFLEKNKIEKILKFYKINIVIHTASLTDVDKCENKKILANKINYINTKNLVDVCEKLKIKIVFISTDQLFDGKKIFYKENDKCNPLNYYSKTKYLSEKYIQSKTKNYLILRGNFFGGGNYYRKSFSEYIIENLKNSIDTYVNSDIFFSPISIYNFITLSNKLIKKNSIGVFNVSSCERISKYNFAMKLAKSFNVNINYLKKNKIKKDKIKALRPINMSLNNSKLLKHLNIKKLPSLDEQIKELHYKKKVKFEKIIQYGEHYLDKTDISEVVRILKGKVLTQGPEIEIFEKNISKYVGSKYAVAVSSCTAGLHLSSIVAGIRKNSVVLTCPITFVSTANAVSYCNGKVEFVDVEIKTGNISIKEVEKKLKKNKNIKAVYPIHFGGFPADMKKLYNLKKKKNFFIIEDAAHSLGSKYQTGEMVGSCKYSDICVFSLHPVKSISAGEGGVITTNNYDIYKRLLRLRSHGINKLDDYFINERNAYSEGFFNPWYYEMKELGYHYRITDFQCALASSQLKKIDKFISKRRKLSNNYDKAFAKSKIFKPYLIDKKKISSRHLYILKINFKKLSLNKAELMQYLFDKKIGTQVHYIPLMDHPYYDSKSIKKENFKNSYNFYNRSLSIPLFYALGIKKQKYIIKIFREIERKFYI